MTHRIAIHPDRVRLRTGHEQSFSARWIELAAAHDIPIREVNADAPDFFDRLAGCHGFMWRFGFDPLSLQRAKRILAAIEHGLALPVFPSWPSSWHFEDKIAQHYLLQAAGIPTPRTWIWWDRDEALRFCDTADYPFVAKLASGIQSDNVRLMRDAAEAKDFVRRMFGSGAVSMARPRHALTRMLRHRVQALHLLAGRPLPRRLQHGYFYAQEFVPGNEYDTRVTIIGDRGFAFRRLNRPGDFRASGSGRIDWEPKGIDLPTVRIAFKIARRLKTQSIAIDALRRHHERLVNEISYTYASWAVWECPGHWVLRGDADTGSLIWVEGHLRPEDAIFADFARAIGCGDVDIPPLPTSTRELDVHRRQA